MVDLKVLFDDQCFARVAQIHSFIHSFIHSDVTSQGSPNLTWPRWKTSNSTIGTKNRKHFDFRTMEKFCFSAAPVQFLGFV